MSHPTFNENVPTLLRVKENQRIGLDITIGDSGDVRSMPTPSTSPTRMVPLPYVLGERC